MWQEVFSAHSYDFKPWIIPTFVSSFFCLFLAIFVYLKNRKSTLNRTFSLFSFLIFIICTGVVFTMSSKEDWLVIFWDRIVYTAFVINYAFLYHFGLAFSKIKKGLPVQLLRLCYLASASFAMIVLFKTEYFLSGVYRYVWGPHAKAALFHHIFMVYAAAVTVGFLFTVFGHYRRTTRTTEKQQAKYMFLAFFVLMFLSFGALTAYGVGATYPFTFLPGTIFVSIVAFTIIRYRLMEIETVIHKTMLWLATSALVFIPISVLLLLLWPWLKSLSPWAGGAIIVFSFFGFLWYYHRLQPRIDHFFQRRRFDPYQVLFRVVSKVSSQEELEGAVTVLNSELKTYLYSRNLVTYIQDEETGEYRLESERGYEERGI